MRKSPRGVAPGFYCLCVVAALTPFAGVGGGGGEGMPPLVSPVPTTGDRTDAASR